MEPKELGVPDETKHFFLERVSLFFDGNNRILISAVELSILYSSAVVFFFLENF